MAGCRWKDPDSYHRIRTTHTHPALNAQLKVSWAWGLSFLVTLFTFFNGGLLMRAGTKIDECVRSEGSGWDG